MAADVKTLCALIDKCDLSFEGRLDNADIIVIGSVCESASPDSISVYIKLDEGKISDIKGSCGPCDPYGFIALNNLMKVIKGMPASALMEREEEIRNAFYELVGLRDADMEEHFRMILKTIRSSVTGICESTQD